MPESQGKTDPQNTKKASPKRDSENLKAGGILGSVRCLWDYLEGIAEKRWESPITKLGKIYLKLYNKLYKPLMFALLLFSVIFIIILFLKLTELIKIFIIIDFILIIIFAIIFAIMFYIAFIEDALYHIIPIFGLKGLARILPALIDELKGKLPKDVEENAQEYVENYSCMKRFRGNATEALSRISQSTFLLMWINFILLSFITLSFIILFVINPILIILHYLLGLKTSSISITGIESAVTKTIKAVDEIALWVLGVALSIIIGLSLFSSQAKFDVNVLRFVYDVKFTVVEWIVVAMFLIITSVITSVMVPLIAVLIMVPAITAFIISITVYIILASTVIDYMQLPRNNQGEN
jgi:hypothetical protein